MPIATPGKKTQGAATPSADNTNKIPASSLNFEWAQKQNDAFITKRANKIARNAVTSMDVMPAARDITTMRSYHDTYGITIPKTGDVTNQRQSGRCWMFAAFNVVRQTIMKKLDVDSFEFSQAYGMFFDKLEKSNASLSYIIDTRDKSLDSRTVSYLIDSVAEDGGYFFFAMNLVHKWGVVPKSAMPETACSRNSSQMDTQLARLLRKDIYRLRKLSDEGASLEELVAAKDEMMSDVYTLLCICLGNPPQHFDLVLEVGKDCDCDKSYLHEIVPSEDKHDEAEKAECTDTPAADANVAKTPEASVDNKDKKDDKDDEPKHMLVHKHLTPLEFTRLYVPFDPRDYVQLVSLPSSKFEVNRVYHVLLTDSVLGELNCRFFNVSQDVLEKAAIASLKDGNPVSMACDVGQQFPRHNEDFNYILALDTIDTNSLFGINFDMDRASMIDTHETCLTHAMVFQGVQLDEKGEPKAWRIENSWGKDAGKDGYLIMSADWYRLYGGEVDVKRSYLSPELLKIWDEGEDIEVMPWENMGRTLNPYRNA